MMQPRERRFQRTNNGARPSDDFVDAIADALQDTLQAAGWAVTSWT